MPYPAHVRKHPKLSATEARAIGTRALVPYQFQAGQSGNPAGSSKSRREQIAACDQAALERTPEALATLTELMRNSLDDRVRTRAAEIIIERGLGKVREAPPLEAEEPKNLRVRIEFVKPSHPEGPEAPAGPIIDATPAPATSAPEPPPPVAQRLTAGQLADLEDEMARLRGELNELNCGVGLTTGATWSGAPARQVTQDARGLSGRRRFGR